METTKNGNHFIARHDSLHDFYDFVAPEVPSGTCPWDLGRVDFIGTKSMDEAQGLARDGWAEVRPAVMSQLAQLDAEVRPMVDLALDPVFDVSGGAVDIDRFLTGDPECMIESTLQPTTKHGRVVKVLVGSMASCGVPKEQLVERGTVLLAMAEILRMAGLSMELWAECRMSSGNGGKNSVSQLVQILAAGSPIDIDDMMFPLAHPSMLRRMFFGGLDHLGPEGKKVGAGAFYGYPPFDPLCGDLLDADVVVPSAMAHKDPITADPTAWLTDKLTELGVIG